MTMHWTWWLIVAALCGAGCGCDALTPRYDAHAWPCGAPTWHACGNGNCCPENTDCGGPNANGQVQYPGCPAGMCCWNGGQDEGAYPWGYRP